MEKVVITVLLEENCKHIAHSSASAATIRDRFNILRNMVKDLEDSNDYIALIDKYEHEADLIHA